MITPLRPADKVTMAAARLKAAGPNTFAEFLDALVGMYGVRAGECVLAPGDQVQKAQGKALQLQEIIDKLTTCTEDARELDLKMKQKEKT